MLRSGIALAGAQVTLDTWKRGEIPATDKDGIITAEEVGSLDLTGTWLVALSACDTGMGKLRAGEGVTGEFMLEFYSSVQKSGNPSEAIASVQRDWLVALRKKQSVLVAVVVAGPFILSFQGPLKSN